jgi:hypothetical protein
LTLIAVSYEYVLGVSCPFKPYARGQNGNKS